MEQQEKNLYVLKYGCGEICLHKSQDYFAVSEAGRAAEIGEFAFIRSEAVEEELDLMRTVQQVRKGTHVYSFEEAEKDKSKMIVPTGKVTIKAKRRGKKRLLKVLKELGLKVLRELGKFLICEITKAISPNPIKCSIKLQLEYGDLVDVAEPELIYPVVSQLVELPNPQNMHYYKRLWHYKNIGIIDGVTHGENMIAGEDMNLYPAYEYMDGFGSDQVICGVVDTGFDMTHKGYRDKIIAPYDAYADDNDASARGGEWHGTSCAYAAIGNLDGFAHGVAPEAKLIPIRLIYITDSTIVNFCEHLKKNGAAVASCSWGAAHPAFRLSSLMIEALKDLKENGNDGKGCVIVFAAGNENKSIDAVDGLGKDYSRITGFATHPDVLTVAASTSMGRRSNYSNFGKSIDVNAPSSGSGGVGITTGDHTGTVMGVDQNGNAVEIAAGYSAGDYTFNFGGTSLSTPLVAGLVCLIRGRNPQLTSEEVMTIIKTAVDRNGEVGDYVGGHSVLYGYGRINALKAVQMVADNSVNAIEPSRHQMTRDFQSRNYVRLDNKNNVVALDMNLYGSVRLTLSRSDFDKVCMYVGRDVLPTPDKYVALLDGLESGDSNTGRGGVKGELTFKSTFASMQLDDLVNARYYLSVVLKDGFDSARINLTITNLNG